MVKRKGIFRTSSRRQGVRTVYTVLRSVLRFFAMFVVFVVAVVLWRKLWPEDAGQGAFDYGEIVTLVVLSLVALALWLLSGKVGREIDEA